MARCREILKAVNHPHVVKLYDSHEMETSEHKVGLLFMERCGNG